MHVAIATSNTPGVEVLRLHGFDVHLLPLFPGGMNPARDLQLVAALLRLYRFERPDLVHHITIKPVMYGGIAARIAGIRAVASAMSGLGFLYISNSLVIGALRYALGFPLRFALSHKNIRVILQNPDDIELFVRRRLVPRKSIVLVSGSGVDEAEFSVRPEPRGNVNVLFPARLLWDKGISEYVEAARLVRRTNPTVRFLIAGAADKNNPRSVSQDILANWVQEGAIEWLGTCNDMPDLLARSHIVCLPSYREGLPKSLIEAASCGRPIVATDVPGCREIVHHGVNGLLVQPRNAAALAGAIQKLLESEELRTKMGRLGRQLVAKQFTLRAIVAQTLNIYRNLLITK
jgi:glycosyltransferase involved in cell wall biosynthesis